MKMSKLPYLVIAAIGTVCFLSGCGEKNHSVSEFVHDKSLLNQYEQKCDNGELSAADQNCLNAIAAKRKIAAEADHASNTVNWADMRLKK